MDIKGMNIACKGCRICNQRAGQALQPALSADNSACVACVCIRRQRGRYLVSVTWTAVSATPCPDPAYTVRQNDLDSSFRAQSAPGAPWCPGS